MDIKKKIAQLDQEIAQELSQVTTLDQLEKIRIDYLGRSGSLAHLMEALKTLSTEEKREIGPLLNALKQTVSQSYDQRKKELEQTTISAKSEKQKYFDVTASLYESSKGSLHVFTHIIEQLENIFLSLGFEIYQGPEVETDYYNFQALNIPDNHPARDLHDTFWLTQSPYLLRTHTSPAQIRVMESKKPPLAIFSPGRCFRHEATDATHDFQFMQYEALYINKNVSVGNLIAVAKTFLQEIFGNKNLNIRVRPGYFPFVEPGLEIDASCPFCKTGCSVCKKTTWIELLGSGLVHPNVLKMSGIDPEIYSGFAFGGGIERLAMVKYGITDIRLFRNSPLAFLNQWP